MASCFFLLRQFEDVLIYLNSVKVSAARPCMEPPCGHVSRCELLTASARICIHVLQSYFYNEDTFYFNYAQAKAAVGNYREAEEVTGLFLHY